MFRLSIFLASFEDWEQEWALYFKPLAWNLFKTQSNICDGAFFEKIVNSLYCDNQKQSSGSVLKNFAKFIRKHLR